MAENITTLLEKPDAENVQGSDYLYIVQGSGSKRDRKIKLEALFASDPAHTLLVDEQDTVKKRYLAPAFFRGSDSGNFDIFFSASDITRDGAKVRVIGAFIGIEKVTTNKLANDAVTNAKIAMHAVSNGSLADKSVSTEKLMDSSVSREKIANGSVSADKLDSTELFTATGWIAFIDDSNFAQYLPTSMTLNAKTSTSVAKTAGFSFSNGGFTCYADVGKFNTLSLGGRSISLPLIQNGSVSLSFSTVEVKDIVEISISPGQILEMFVRHRCTWTGGNGVSEAYTYLIDEDGHGDRIHWNFSGINGLYQSQSLIVQNTTDTNKTFYLRVNFDLSETSSVEDSVDYRYVIRSL